VLPPFALRIPRGLHLQIIAMEEEDYRIVVGLAHRKSSTNCFRVSRVQALLAEQGEVPLDQDIRKNLIGQIRERKPVP